MNTFTTKYLQANDLSESEDTVLTIRRFEKIEMMQDERTVTKWVLHFEEIEAGLPLNDTNGREISKLYSRDMDSWLGKRIVLYVFPVKYSGVRMNGIRVRPQVPA